MNSIPAAKWIDLLRLWVRGDVITVKIEVSPNIILRLKGRSAPDPNRPGFFMIASI
jgi:hypothetical protein